MHLGASSTLVVTSCFKAGAALGMHTTTDQPHTSHANTHPQPQVCMYSCTHVLMQPTGRPELEV
jgi:hypothetical protein